jgi:hypothetical protein
MPLTEKRCDELELHSMVANSTDPKKRLLRFLLTFLEKVQLQESLQVTVQKQSKPLWMRKLNLAT